MVQINFSNRVLYTITAVFILIIIGGIVYAYGGSAPSVMGHSSNEIMISINGQGKTLQEAIDGGSFGGDGGGGLIFMDAGEIPHGKVIPLPEGISDRSKCKHIVSIRALSAGYGAYGWKNLYCYVDQGSGVVQVYSTRGGTSYGHANYLIICTN